MSEETEEPFIFDPSIAYINYLERIQSDPRKAIELSRRYQEELHELKVQSHCIASLYGLTEEQRKLHVVRNYPSLNKIAEKMIQEESARNRVVAKRSRPTRQHKYKPMVKEWWDKWQIGVINYKDDAAFKNAMMDKFGKTDSTDKEGIGRPNTILEWVAEWKAELSPSRLGKGA